MTRRGRSAAWSVAGLLLVAGALAPRPAAGEQKEPPFITALRIPKLAKAPVIDGKIGKDEWSGAGWCWRNDADCRNPRDLLQSRSDTWR